jgi:hypothetical protein
VLRARRGPESVAGAPGLRVGRLPQAAAHCASLAQERVKLVIVQLGDEALRSPGLQLPADAVDSLCSDTAASLGHQVDGLRKRLAAGFGPAAADVRAGQVSEEDGTLDRVARSG